MQAEENGCWYANVAEAHVGDEYKFLLTTEKGEFKRIDPYAREVTSSVGNAIVHDPTFDWQGDDFQLAPWNEVVIYELHVGTFNDEEDDRPSGQICHDFGASGASEKARRQRDPDHAGGRVRGRTVLGLQPRPHLLGGERLWRRVAFKQFVKRAHQEGIAVILDVVYNHLGPSDLDLWQFDGWSENDRGGIYFYNDDRATRHGEKPGPITDAARSGNISSITP